MKFFKNKFNATSFDVVPKYFCFRDDGEVVK